MSQTRLFAALVSILLLTPLANAQIVGSQTGPLAFTPAPVGTQAVTLKYERMRASTGYNGQFLKGVEILTNSVYPTYSHYFNFFGRTGQIQLAVAWVDLEGELQTPVREVSLFHESGFADPYFHFATSLIGGEAKTPKEWFEEPSGFSLSTFAAVRPPIGSYDQTLTANASGNRWEFRLGLPLIYSTGEVTKQTTYEITPFLYLFGENDEAFGGVTTEQDTVLQIEGHVTRDLLPFLRASFNLVYVGGGDIQTDGVASDTPLDYLSIGATLGGRLSRSIGLEFTYARRLHSHQEFTDGNFIRAGMSYQF